MVIKFIVAVLAFCAFSAQAGEQPIFEDGQGKIHIGPLSFKDTGVRIEDGLTVTNGEYKRLKTGEVLPFGPQETKKYWSTYYLYIVTETVVKEQLVLDGKLIRKVKKEVVTKKEVLNPFLPLAALCILEVVLIRIVNVRKNQEHLANIAVLAAAIVVGALVCAFSVFMFFLI